VKSLWQLYRVIQSSSRLQKEVIEKIIWSIKCKQFFCRFSTLSEVRSFYVGVAFIVVIVDLYKVKTICFNMICHLFSLCIKEERHFAFVAFLKRHIGVATPFCVLHFRSCGGDLSDLLLLKLSDSANCSSAICTSLNS